MSGIKMLLMAPGTDTNEGWLYPKVCWFLYIIYLVLCCLFDLWYLATAFYFLVAQPWLGFVLIILSPIIFLLQLLVIRVAYEGWLLFFRILEANREMVGRLAEMNESVRQSAETQTRGLQYICDRLAQICDNMEKK